jgi:hypothetical protein
MLLLQQPAGDLAGACMTNSRVAVCVLQIMLTGLVIFSGIGTVCGGIIFQWRRNAASRQANMLKVRRERHKSGAPQTTAAC